MSSDSVSAGVVFREQGYCGIVTVSDGPLIVWSEMTSPTRFTVSDALRDAEIRRMELVDEGEAQQRVPRDSRR